MVKVIAIYRSGKRHKAISTAGNSCESFEEPIKRALMTTKTTKLN